ncbi:MAG TPA: uroporphyrinogen decarboxylase family protein [Sedimentisphaerales bacterium]|nr:uroporphyrinogen decarboxylase family protein [Sedimentisphaerales bacterium]
MTNEQWEKLLAVIDGEPVRPMPVGFIIDSPWLPGWAGIETLDYFSSEQMWFEANLKAVRQFPDAILLPGFWAEFGMCTEPSAFGAKCSWHENDLPYAGKIIADIQSAASVSKPNPAADGLLPFVLNRLKRCQAQIEAEGHSIRFAVSRGPLNIASFLMGTTEFLMAIRTDPDLTHKLLGTVTDFIIDWLGLQIRTFASIDGLFILDDIVGFLGERDFTEMAMPYLKRIFDSFQTSVKFFHNDAAGLVCAPHLASIGVNLFNFSFQHTLAEMKKLTNNEVTLLGNIPTRDVLASGTPEDVHNSVAAAMESIPDRSRIILSCGGGMPPDVPTENIEALLAAARKL